MSDLSKTIIRIIQDFCFQNSAINFCDKFSVYLSSKILNDVESKTLELSSFIKIAERRKDFCSANEIEVIPFCKDLFKKLNYELSFYQDVSLLQSIIAFKRKMENGNFRGYKKESSSEDTLRCTLNLYLNKETFCEARSAGGQNDICIPSEKVIIETKLWNGLEYYNSGFPELDEYLEKANYREGFYIIFDYNKNSNDIIIQNGEVFDVKYNNKNIHVVFIRMNPIRPSEKYKYLNEKDGQA